MKLTCVMCGKKLIGRQRRFCSTKCKNGRHQLYSWQHDRGIRYRNELIALAGGKCTKCGYKRNAAALNFHHVDPKTKSFPLDIRSCSNRSKQKCVEEMKKCILLCSNCHIELHYPEQTIA